MRDESAWLRKGADTFYRLVDCGDSDTIDTWRDTIMWCALQVSQKNKNTRDWQAVIENNYEPGARGGFRCFCKHLSFAAAQNPHQNAPLRLMREVHLAPPGIDYTEEEAKKLLLEDIWAGNDPRWAISGGRTVWEQLELASYLDTQATEQANSGAGPLERIQYLTMLDDHCMCTLGCKLIVIANAWRELQPMDFPNRLLLVASDIIDPTYAMMSYIQLACMGMACYVLTDNEYQAVIGEQHGLFAPPTALCSKAFGGLCGKSVAGVTSRRDYMAKSDKMGQRPIGITPAGRCLVSILGYVLIL